MSTQRRNVNGISREPKSAFAGWIEKNILLLTS